MACGPIILCELVALGYLVRVIAEGGRVRVETVPIDGGPSGPAGGGEPVPLLEAA